MVFHYKKADFIVIIMDPRTVFRVSKKKEVKGEKGSVSITKTDPDLRDKWAQYRQGGALWKAARRMLMVTGSRVGDALGVGYNSRWSYYKEQRAMYLYLTGQVDQALGRLGGDGKMPQRPVPSLFARDRMRHGQRWEAHALKLFRALEMGHDIYDPRLVDFPTLGLVLSPENPEYGASPDSYIPKPVNAVVEIKCRYPNTSTEGQPSVQCYGGYDSETPIPVSHLCQMVLEMHCTGATAAYYVCLGLESGAVTRPVDPGARYQYRLVVQRFQWDQDLWDRVIHPRLQFFSRAVRSPPGTHFPCRVGAGMAKKLKAEIRENMMKQAQPVSMYKGYTSMSTPV